MRRRRLAKRRRLVEVLKIFSDHRFAQQFPGQAPRFAFKKFAEKLIVLVQALDLLQRGSIGLVP